MASWRTHIIFGVTFTWIVMLAINFFYDIFDFSLVNIIIITLLATFFSIISDADHPVSKITATFIFIGLILLILGITDLFIYNTTMLNGKSLIIISAIFLTGTFYISQSNGLFAHRGVTHCFWFGLILLIPLYFIGLNSIEYLTAAFIAFNSHLIADGIILKTKITPSGGRF